VANYCAHCGMALDGASAICSHCGAAQAPPPGQAPAPPYQAGPGYQQQNPYQQPAQYQQPPVYPQPYGYQPPKSRVAYVLLGLFLGTLGIHNFYAGYNNKAVIQLLLSVLLCWTIVVPVGVMVWVIVEICTVTQDSTGAFLT
jgi:TM2 domain-containing membrane protein YozV